jgi:hypothetical protein
MSIVPSLHHPLGAIPLLAIAAIALTAGQAVAGQYAPAAGNDGSTAIFYDDPAFVGWATGVASYKAGSGVEKQWQDTSKCLGEAGTDIYDITCLGNGGTVTLSFDGAITNGEGWDFAVFENGFGDGFLELAYVEVSSDGVNFVRFPCHSGTKSPVGAYTTTMDPTNIDGLAGKYKVGYGTPFDLSDLEGLPGANKVDLNHITQVRIVDIIGDGSAKESDSNPIYDPYPCVGSGGFDLDAVGVLHFADVTSGDKPHDIAVSTDASGVTELTASISGADVKVKWPGELSKTYIVEESTDLKTWSTVKSDIKGVDATMILTLTAPNVATFYSVSEQ